MEAFDPKRYARFKKTLTLSWNHFVQSEAVVLTVYIHHIALETLGAILECDDQRVMTLL